LAIMLACNCNITPTRNFFSRYNIDLIAPAKYSVVELIHSYSVLSRPADRPSQTEIGFERERKVWNLPSSVACWLS
jgi:hypothetical protein